MKTMNEQIYQDCLKEIKRIDVCLAGLDRLVIIDSAFAAGRISYNEAIDKILALEESQRAERQIPVEIKSELPRQISIQ